MSKQDFIWICNEHTVNPSIAMEDEGVIDILKMKVTNIKKQLALSTYLKNLM